MEMWLFFTIFGLVLFVPSASLFLWLQHMKKTILVVIKHNGTIRKVVINDKILALGKIEYINGKKIAPIKIFQNEIRYGSFRRWIIKDLEVTPVINKNSGITDAEIESYLNSETIMMLLLFGKTKQLLLLLLGIIIFCVIVGAVANGYMINSKECELTSSNQTMHIIEISTRNAILNPYGEVLQNGSYG